MVVSKRPEVKMIGEIRRGGEPDVRLNCRPRMSNPWKDKDRGKSFNETHPTGG